MNQTTKHSQATIRKIIAIMITSIVLFSLLPTNIILAENSKTSANLNDYSELLVDVIQDSEIVYSGKLGGFANGVYANVNFEKLDLLCVYQLSEDKTFTIIPIEKSNNAEREITENTDNVQSNVTTAFLITYDIAYTISEGNMDIEYMVSNFENDIQTVNLIAVLYKDGMLRQIMTVPFEAAVGTTSANILMVLPETEVEQYNVKMMVWENFNTLRSFENTKTLRDIEPYQREKTTVISATDGQEFKLYMNSDNVIGNNSETEHIIKYNPQKFAILDLCGFTAEKELITGEIENTGVTIQSIDTEMGKIIFRFNLPEGRNTGINNIINFKALSDVSDEEIIYEVQ